VPQGQIISFASEFVFNATQQRVAIYTAAEQQRTNLIAFGHALPKAINNLHRQKASCSTNLDRLEVEPSLRDSIS
jgi:hypothetical protein